MSYEKNTVEELILGEANTFTVINRVSRALFSVGKDDDHLNNFVKIALNKAGNYNEFLDYCAEALVEAGYKWGNKIKHQDEILAEAIFSGRYDGMTIGEMKKRLNIE